MKIILSFLLTAASTLLLANIAYASCSCPEGSSANYTTKDACESAKCTWTAIPTNAVQLNNPLTGNATSKDVPTLLGTVINYVLGIVGSLALVMFIFGGITWMMSAGNQESVTKGKNIIIWAALGLVIIFTSYALVRFVLKMLTNT